jgi:RNA polymerase sigma factor (sigma-70 family)
VTTQVLIGAAEDSAAVGRIRPVRLDLHGLSRGAVEWRGLYLEMQADAAQHLAGARLDALAQLASLEVALRRTARRHSLCRDDAEDAYQRTVEILLTKSPPADPRHLAAWMQVVTRREALAVRRSREQLLGPRDDDRGDPLDRIASDRADPQERLERREQLADAIRLLIELKPQERLALVLQAHGYSYAEIRQLCGWTYTKVNRCLAEGRARLRQLGAM